MGKFNKFHKIFGDVIMGENRRHGFKDWGLVKYYSRNSDSKYFENASVNSNSSVQKTLRINKKIFFKSLILKQVKTQI